MSSPVTVEARGCSVVRKRSVLLELLTNIASRYIASWCCDSAENAVPQHM